MTDYVDDSDDDEDDESDDDDDRDDVDNGWTNEPELKEKSMDESTEKPVTKPATTPKSPARRVARGLLGAQSVAKAASANKPTSQAAPPPEVRPAPKPDLAKDGIAFTEEAFNAFLATQGIDAASHPFAQLKVWGGVIAKKAKDALETGTSPVDAWTSAVKSLADMIPQMLAAKKLDEATASKIQAVIRYFLEALKAIEAAEASKVKPSRIEEPKQVSAKKTELGVAPPAAPAKAETPKSELVSMSCPSCGKDSKGPYRYTLCIHCGAPLGPEPPAAVQPAAVRSKPLTDPNAPTELNTPAPGSSPTPSSSSTNGERSTITPEQRALVAAAAASIPDEQSVSYRPTAAQAPKPPEASAAPLPPPAWCDPNPYAAPVAPPAPRVGYVPPQAAPPAAAAPQVAPPQAPVAPAAVAPQAAPTAAAQKSNKLLVAAVCILGLIAAILVWHFAVAPQVLQSAPQSPVAAAAGGQSETCTKVTDSLVRQYYGQAKASEFSLAERPGVRLICAGKMVYKNPSTGLYDIRPCQICYK